MKTFQPTRPLRGATPQPARSCRSSLISTHAPLAGRDGKLCPAYWAGRDFNPRAPCGARHRGEHAAARVNVNFNPRAPCGARRACAGALLRAAQDFNPRAPCGARHGSTAKRGDGMSISTHAPLAGRDPRPRPRRGSTKISTHAPLAGRDRRGLHREEDNYYFNPRAPCGARQLGTEYRNKGQKKFQPTRPLRGATSAARQKLYDAIDFNPRAPCGARPRSARLLRLQALNFNPRAPCGARQQKCTNHYAHFCDNRQISDAFAQNAACQGILLLFDAGKPCGFWVRTAQVISARLCFAL